LPSGALPSRWTQRHNDISRRRTSPHQSRARGADGVGGCGRSSGEAPRLGERCGGPDRSEGRVGLNEIDLIGPKEQIDLPICDIGNLDSKCRIRYCQGSIKAAAAWTGIFVLPRVLIVLSPRLEFDVRRSGPERSTTVQVVQVSEELARSYFNNTCHDQCPPGVVLGVPGAG
jgi:hypothetical protein